MLNGEAGIAQAVVARLSLAVVPPSPSVLGQPLTLRVRPPAPGAPYRFLATMLVTGTGLAAAGTACATPQTIGTGSQTSWTPASGAYRLTVTRIKSLAARDSVSVTHQVNAPNGGFLNTTVIQGPNPQPPGKLILSLRTNDRGPGHRYQWLVRFTAAPGAPANPPVTWTGDTAMHLHTVPLVLPPGTYSVSARVGIHRGDACQIIATSTGALLTQVIH
jgi:hypothetical protein